MKLIFPLMALMLISGCATVQNQSAICSGSAALRTAHAAALVADGGALSKASGAALIGTIDAGCGDF